MTTTINAKAEKVAFRFGYIEATMADGTTRQAGTDRTFGVRNPQGAWYRCNCGAHYNLPRHIAGHLINGSCAAL